MNASKKINSITGLKAIAFIMIFVSHLDRLSGYANGLGAAGVSVFIVISGVLMTVRHYEDASSHYAVLDNLKWGGNVQKRD